MTPSIEKRRVPRQGKRRVGLLINIDTGGTLTDFCIIDGQHIHWTKSITTPYDLSKCLFDGLTKASRALYGEEDLRRLLLATDHIRYSTTQGTNALVERKGPRLGLLCLTGLDIADLTRERSSGELFEQLVGDRWVTLEASGDDPSLEQAAVLAVNRLTAGGATRLIVSAAGPGRISAERRVKRLLLRKFPPHLLGALPILYSHELVADEDDARRTWTALFNAFLHPAMERFLYGTEHRLRDHKIRKPLLIFRNDGGASRVARTSAVKTYSSGPRGGAEGLRALAVHYGFDHVVGMDVGGTTTDIALVERGEVHTARYGAIENVTSSLPLCKVVSVGVGGSSIIRVVDGALRVGPDSAGSAPGPASFGFGGSQATITDVLVAGGLLDPATYFGGQLTLDVPAARRVIEATVAQPLGLEFEEALSRMETAWVGKVVESVRSAVPLQAQTVLVAFGGAGPLLATRIAAAAGLHRVLIPGLAAVFSAFGVGFSDISHEFEQQIDPRDPSSVNEARRALRSSAARAMYAEGIELADCAIEEKLDPHSDSKATLVLRAVKSVPRAKLTGTLGKQRPPARLADGGRRILSHRDWLNLPLLKLEGQHEGFAGEGPLVLEEAFFTARVDAGWRFECDPGGDILLTRPMGAAPK
ncbi:MAG: hydantoinase/oxoprolinase family protein [Gammaproteobacteria bacterium]|nr:hydantoinase/oxoprolinase family protein [Gammaproteobacteria bacterium]